jgi:hypothetical protein
MSSRHLTFATAILILPVTCLALVNKTGRLNEPYLEWKLEWDGVSEDPYDVIAHARFTHARSGEQIRSLMFYDGDGRYRFRFTGTRPGKWTLHTTGPGPLDGQTAEVVIEPSPKLLKGFLTADGARWIWAGTGEPHIPQLVMSKDFSAYWTGQAVDTAKIDADILEFISETGFTGFHKAGVASTWFDIDGGRASENADPDPPAFEVIEAFLLRAYAAGASTHLWMWGAHGGPDEIGGPLSEADQRVLRYIAARLGPIPGWSMGYGYDLHSWAPATELQAWYDFLKSHLDGWPHLIGARADRYDCNNARMLRSLEEGLPRNCLSEVFWQGDYRGHYDYRVPYSWYTQVLEDADRPQFEEDRFRNRSHRIFQNKDYTPEMTVRGLWHSTMAGGVANIWGNLLPGSDRGGSQPYDNEAKGNIQGTEFTVDIKDQIKTYHEFWFGRKRFSYDLLRDNKMTASETGPAFLSPKGGDPIAVCLRDTNQKRFVFYIEDADTIRMDLRGMKGKQAARAIDTRRAYQERALGSLEPGLHSSLELPYRSDWAVAAGVFPE